MIRSALSLRGSVKFIPSSKCTLLPKEFYQIRHSSSTGNDNSQDAEEMRHRHSGILMHPNSISKLVLPGNCVHRITRKGEQRRKFIELEHGYFWMIKDLKRSDEKPLLSNETLIPESQAKLFPTLKGLKSLTKEKVDLPDYFTRRNRSQDAAAQCTLVAISFRDFGFQQLPSWIEPFQEQFGGNDRTEVIKINFTDGWLNKWILRGFIQGMMVRNTPIEERPNTFLFFGDNERFRDSLRMHNLMSGYVFLMDGLGRVRFAGSGQASSDEAKNLVQLTKNMIPLLQRSKRELPSASNKKW